MHVKKGLRWMWNELPAVGWMTNGRDHVSIDRGQGVYPDLILSFTTSASTLVLASDPPTGHPDPNTVHLPTRQVAGANRVEPATGGKAELHEI